MKKKLSTILLTLFAMACVFASEPIQPSEKTELFNGKDLSGWKVYLQNGAEDKGTFKVEDGVIRCTGKPAGYLRTEQDYKNYKLHLEWRWAGKPGNSGVLLHMSEPDKVWPKSIECQLMHGNAGDFYVIDGTEMKEHSGPGRRVKKIGASSEKPAGEWNVYEIVCKDDGIFPVVNGELKNVGTQTSVKSGKICVQSEGAPIEFRNIYIEPLD